MSVHYQQLEDEDGELVDLVPFCSDSCQQEWCAANEEVFGGTYTAEGSEAGEWCEACGVIVSQPAEWDACRCGWDNVVVNRFGTDETERCEHGLVIQVAKLAPERGEDTLTMAYERGPQ